MSAEKQYPWLSQHRIAKPCKVKWSDMSGDEKKRFCGQCKLNVYNLSSMTSDEAEALLKKNNGRICTYFYQRSDGKVLTQDCPVGLRQVYRRQGALAAALYALSLLVAPLARAEEAVPGGPAVAPVEMLGGAPPMLGTDAHVEVPAPGPSPSPAPTATPKAAVTGGKRLCPRPLLGRAAVKR